MRHYFRILSTTVFLFFLISLQLWSTTPTEGYSHVPLRGNSLDIHFSNLTNAAVKVQPYYFDNKDKVPGINDRNLLFIPNSGISIYKNDDMPIAFTLQPAKLYASGKQSKLVAKKFIQGILVYNNVSTYRNNKLKNYGYNNSNHYTTFSSYMWTNGVTTRSDGSCAFSNAMNEINNFMYKVDIVLSDNRHLTFDLVFNTKSNLNVLTTTTAYTAYRLKLLNIADAADQVAALTDLAGGILLAPLNPGAGVLQIVSGAAWEVQAVAQTMADNYVSHKTTQTERGYSWLSSPFDILVYPENYYIKNKDHKIISVPEYDWQKGNIMYFLGNNSKPESIIVQISSSAKGDLFINIMSNSITRIHKISDLEHSEEFIKITGKKS